MGPTGATATQVPISKPSFGEEELELIRRPLEDGWVVQGPFVQEFERRFEQYTGVEHAVATTSCTTALHLAVVMMGLQPGDEVIVPAFTWISTANVVVYQGATPVFCDIDLETFNVDPARIETLIGERTVGIMAVHLFGLCADMDEINAIARRHDLWVIEDAACAFGSRQHGRHAGTLGDLGCFSFHPRKSITTGEGGMLTTGQRERAAQARSLRDHGASRSDRERHLSAGSYVLPEYDVLGFNYRMTDIQGALGCAQMGRAQWILDRRKELAGRYEALLADCDWLVTPKVPAGNVHSYQAYVCLFAPQEPLPEAIPALHERRNAVMATLEQRGIATRPGTHAPVQTRYYADRLALRPEAFPIAHAAERLSLALPLYPDMTDAQQELVVSELLRAF